MALIWVSIFIPLLVPGKDYFAFEGDGHTPTTQGTLSRRALPTLAGGSVSDFRRVVAARRIQNERFRKSSNRSNSSMSPRQMKLHCQINSEATGYLEHAMEEMNFSARAHDRILKVARTLADLSGSPEIRASDILEAIQYRSLDRKLFS